MPSAAVEGIDINYRIEGDAPETLVLVTGWEDDLGTWGHQVPAFVESGYRVLVFDDLHLLGVSMGGMIAQEYASAHPTDLRSVILACTYAALGPFCSGMFSF